MTTKSSKSGKSARAADKAKQIDSAKSADNSAASPPESAADSVVEKSAESVDSPDSSAADSNTSESSVNESAEIKDPLADLSADDLRDMVRRIAAEQENLLRRAAQEIDKARKFALNNFAEGIGEVFDCLQAALDGVGSSNAINTSNKTDGKTDNKTDAASSDLANQNMREGVELTLRKLSATMEASGIRSVRPDIGATFDPTLHEAIGINADANQTENTVAAVVRVGYTLNGRVVRAAQIIVYKKGS